MAIWQPLGILKLPWTADAHDKRGGKAKQAECVVGYPGVIVQPHLNDASN